MTMTTTRKFVSRTGAVLYIRANFAEASSPLLFSWHNREHFEHSPFQVADARHRPLQAAKLVSDWCEHAYGR
jgi:hypothetical protein